MRRGARPAHPRPSPSHPRRERPDKTASAPRNACRSENQLARRPQFSAHAPSQRDDTASNLSPVATMKSSPMFLSTRYAAISLAATLEMRLDLPAISVS